MLSIGKFSSHRGVSQPNNTIKWIIKNFSFRGQSNSLLFNPKIFVVSDPQLVVAEYSCKWTGAELDRAGVICWIEGWRVERVIQFRISLLYVFCEIVYCLPILNLVFYIVWQVQQDRFNPAVSRASVKDTSKGLGRRADFDLPDVTIIIFLEI